MKTFKKVIIIFFIIISLNLVSNCSFCDNKENGYWYTQYTIWEEASSGSNNQRIYKKISNRNYESYGLYI